MKIILGTLAVVVVAALALAAYLGAFASVVAAPRDGGPWVLVGLDHVGPFREVGTVMAQVKEKAVSAGFRSAQGYGLFADDPKRVAAKDLRWEAGLLTDKLDAPMRAALLKAGLKVSDWPRQRCVAAEFPLRNSLSFGVAPLKAYPAIQRAMPAGASPAGPALEIYGESAITFLFPIKP